MLESLGRPNVFGRVNQLEVPASDHVGSVCQTLFGNLTGTVDVAVPQLDDVGVRIRAVALNVTLDPETILTKVSDEVVCRQTCMYVLGY